MLKETITYKNFADVEVEEDFYFNLTEAELTKMEVSMKGGLSASIQFIQDSKDARLILQEFERIAKAAYGVRSDDGTKFRKTQEAWDEFTASEAYSVFFLGIMGDPDKASAFVNGIMPADLVKKAQAARLAKAEGKEPEAPVAPAADGFRAGFDPNYRPTPPEPVAAAPAPEPVAQPYEPAVLEPVPETPVYNQPPTPDPTYDNTKPINTPSVAGYDPTQPLNPSNGN